MTQTKDFFRRSNNYLVMFALKSDVPYLRNLLQALIMPLGRYFRNTVLCKLV